MTQVSVVIPVFNRAEELKRSLKSILDQTVQDFEIFVVDDYSEIDLMSVVNEFNDKRIKYFKLDKKGNANVCRNLGIKHAQGKYIAMLDSDDEWLPEHLEKKIKVLEESNADGVFGSYYIDNGETKQNIISRAFYKNESIANYLLTDGRAATPTQLYKAECAKAISWDENLLRHQDFDFSIRFAEKYKFVPSNEITCIVHWKKGEVRTESLESQLQFFKKHQHNIQPNIYNKYFSNLFFQIVNRSDVSSHLKNYIRKESTKHIRYCSLVDYLSIESSNKGELSRAFLRLKFCFKVLLS